MDRFRGLFSLHFLKVRAVNFFCVGKEPGCGWRKNIKNAQDVDRNNTSDVPGVALASAARD